MQSCFHLGVALAGLLVLSVAGCREESAPTAQDARAAAQKIRFATDWYPQAEHGGYYNALVRGYYADAGLDVTILPGNPRDTAERRVATGDAQLGMSSSDAVLIAHEHGLSLEAVTTTLQHDPQAIMVHADSPVKTLADLSHHRVSVATGIPWFRYVVSKYHLQGVQEIPLTYTVANFVHDPTYIQQAFVTSEPYFVRQQGVEPRLLPIRESGFDSYRVLMTTRDFAAANPALVRRFVEASLRGWSEYLKDPAAANAEILKRNPEMTKGQLTSSWPGAQRWPLHRRLRRAGRAHRPDDPAALAGAVRYPQASRRAHDGLQSAGGVHARVQSAAGTLTYLWFGRASR